LERVAPRIVSASPWPEADALFRSDPRWLGSDDAYSIELSPGRILWLFGDTFVEGISRRDATFIRNSVGIQTGSDPSSASISFHFGRTARGEPDSFFRGPPGTWYWPLHGAVVGDALLLFVMLVRSPIPGGTGGIDEWRYLGPLGFFEVFGWAALRVSNPSDDPALWDVRVVAERHGPAVVGAGVLLEGDRLLAYAWDEIQRVSLARWPIDELRADALREPEWWTGTGWRREVTQRSVVIERGSTEFTVHKDAAGYCQTQVIAEEIALRRAEAPDGPWSSPETVFSPEETQRPGVFVYAGKAHPHLAGADLVLTYASNADVDVCLDDDSIYYPRFVRVTEAR
jgi:hypothetical protein